MDIVDKISSAECWELFLENKIIKQKLSEKEAKCYREFIDDGRYLSTLPYFRDENSKLPVPVRKMINKTGTSKKRVIYSFGEDFNTTLKFVAYCLHEYDDIFSKNCLAFKNGSRVRDVLRHAGRKENLGKYALKLDLSDYFNSIDEELLIRKLDF